MIHADNSTAAGKELPFRDVTIHSSRTRMRGVKALNIESRPWINSFPVCPALNQYHLVHVGIMEATAPTRIVRTNQTTTYFLATFAGTGKVLVDGEPSCQVPCIHSGDASAERFDRMSSQIFSMNA